jgi:hypothetical protein
MAELPKDEFPGMLGFLFDRAKKRSDYAYKGDVSEQRI